MLDLDRLPSRPVLVALALIGASAATQDESMGGSIVAPVSRHAVVDETGPGASRPVVHVLADGRVVAGDELLFDPEKAGEVARLRAWLSAAAAKMEKEPVESGGAERSLPTGELRLHADRSAPFRSVQHVLAQCGARDVWIWKLQLAVERDSPKEDGGPSYLRFRLPLLWAEGLESEGPLPIYVEVILRVLNPGTKLARETGEPWEGATDGIWDHGPDRRAEYQFGPYKTTQLADLSKRIASVHKRYPEWPSIIDPRDGVAVADVVTLIDAILDAGFEEYAFVGPPD